jgi:hypothetical protein
MSDKSPLFVSALELLAHAVELYASGHSKKYKFVILHLANSVELVLKDCLIDHNISIYKNPKETITIWGAFEELDKLKIVIPEKPIIELLIDDRNTIQHRFGFPNAESVFYYLEQVVKFFNRFLDEQYKVKLSEALSPHLSKENLALIGLVPDDLSHLKDLFKISPQAAVVQAYAMIESKLLDLVQVKPKDPRHPLLAKDSLRVLVEQGKVTPDILKVFDRFRDVRNLSAHGAAKEISKAEFDETLKSAIMVLELLDTVSPNNSDNTEGKKVSKPKTG